MLDAEALLLVDDQQAQILKFHVLLEEAVGADEQIDAPLLQPPQGVLHLGLGAEAADHVDLHRVLGKALLGRQVVLPGQHGGTRMAACLPSSTHFMMARKATSVLP